MEKKKRFFISCFFGLILLFTLQSHSIRSYISIVKDHYQGPSAPVNDNISIQTIPVTAIPSNEEQARILSIIQQQAKKSYEAPINATIDHIWKAIPAYNGIQIDIEKTFQLAISGRTREKIPFIYKEINPSLTLDDLGPQPIYKGNSRKPMVAFMINVAWGNEYIEPILDILRRENIHATFFFDGSWLNKNLETAKKIAVDGHELSNHAYSHKNMSQLSNEAAYQEISKTQKLLKEQLGVDNKLFAPPSGDFDDNTVRIAYQLKLRTVLWTFDTVDWKKPSPSSIVQKAARLIEPGSIILMHPTSASSQALQGMIDVIHRKGLVIGTVSDLISAKRVPAVEASANF